MGCKFSSPVLEMETKSYSADSSCGSTQDINQKSLRADESSASSSMTMGGMINNMKPQALQASQISNTMSSRGNNIIAGSHSGLEPLTDSTKNAENDEAEFIDKLSSGQVKTRRPTGFNLRRGASAQAIVEDPQHKEVYCKRRTTIYASTEMGLKQEYKAPFSTDVCGTFSCHGIAPAEEEEPDDMLRMVIGNTSVDKAKVYQKVNQDRGCVVYPFNSNPNEALFLVLDGHGDQGDRVSEFVMTEIVCVLEKNPEAVQKEPLVALTNAFTSAEASLKATKDIKAMSSGTTVAVVYAAGDTLYVANAGDTRVVVARHVRDSERQKLVDVADAGETPCVNPPVSGAAGSNQVGNASTSHSTRIINTVISNVPVLPKCDKCCPIMLTVDHKPDDPVEMARITAHKGYVSVPVHASSSTSVNSTFAGPSSIDADGNITDEFFDTVPAEPLKKQAVGSVAAARVWLDPKHTLVGLAMSRSIGDFAAKTVGVTATPSVIKYNVHTNDKFMIIASDGVWEFMDIQDAVNIVQTNLHLGAFTACQVLIQAAEKLWRKNEGDYRDDITAIVILLPFVGKPSE